MPRAHVLFVTATTGYQARSFQQAARALDVGLLYVTDRCHALEDPWRDGAIAVRFDDEAGAVEQVHAALAGRPVAGVVAAGDRPARLAANVARALAVSWHPPDGVRVSTNKLLARGRLLAAGLPVPWFVGLGPDDTIATVAPRLRFPCVVKPLTLTGSRGVIRADSPDALEQALARVRKILDTDGRPAGDDPERTDVVIEGFIPGREVALEGVLENGALRVFAIFDKPDPLDGPFFEETLYVTPAALDASARQSVAVTVARAALSLGLHHGPIHAECRINEAGVFVLEVAPRPIGGLCAGALRFADGVREGISLEELLLRHAIGEPLDGFGREASASGVMMIPTPRRGRLRAVRGIPEAEQVPGIDQVLIAARPDQLLVPLPEGASYLGFIFARGGSAGEVEAALREAHARLHFAIDPAIPVA